MVTQHLQGATPFAGGTFPVLYPILDAAIVLRDAPPGSPTRHLRLERLARDLASAGVTLLQYRNKCDPDSIFLEDSLVLREAAPSLRLILNDRPALVPAARAHGVHVGQSDMPPAKVRSLLGPHILVGLSTNTGEEVLAADREPVDSIAIGPIFATASKSDTNPVVGLEGIRRARALTRKPLIAIGGISLANAAAVLAAGADSLAIIGAIFAADCSPAEAAHAFLSISR